MFHSLSYSMYLIYAWIYKYILFLFYFIESHSSKVNWRKIVFTRSFAKFRQGNRSYKYVQFEINQRQDWRAWNEIHRFLTVLYAYFNVNIIFKTSLVSTLPPYPTSTIEMWNFILYEYDIFGILRLLV